MKKVIILIFGLLVFFFSLPKTSYYSESFNSEEAGKISLTNVGVAPFAIAHRKFPCQKFLNSISDVNHLSIAWLYNTFGSNYSCIKILMADPRLELLETNLINEPGHRNKRLERREFLYRVSSPEKYNRLLINKNENLRKRFFRYVAPVQKLLGDNLRPETQCLINPGLESNVSDKAGKVLVSWAREAFPNCRIVWNPLKPGSGRRSATNADLIEGHGPTPNINTPCLSNLDGTDINFKSRISPALKYYKEGDLKNYVNAGAPLQQHIEDYANRCEVAFLWVTEYNCVDPSAPPNRFVAPTKRTCESGVYRAVAKEVKIAQKYGLVYPQEFVWSQEEERSFLGCREIKNPDDGDKQGFLLKQSEFADRGGVILAHNHSVEAKLIYKGNVVDVYVNGGQYHDEPRDIFRSNKSPLSYPFKVAIKFSDGVCYRVNNPRIRND